MKVIFPGILALAVLAGCDGNPVTSGSSSSGTTTSGPVSNTSVATLPGTDNPTASGSITRQEALNSPQDGNGYVASLTPSDSTATPAKLTIDGLGFDGGNVYTRDTVKPSLNGYAVYAASSTYNDSVTGANIDQFTYRALYGVSTTGKTNFAIVRTGSYIPYGFGGFIYERHGGVTLPSKGQAQFTGKYAGLVDYNNRADMNYTQGDMTVSMDFADFNNGNAVKGEVTNRKIYDLNGTDITATMIGNLNTNLKLSGTSAALTSLPIMKFTVGPGVMDKNGELAGTLGSNYVDANGASQSLETGNYYAVIAGDATTANSEVAGIIVVTSPDSYYDGVTARETGGFILYR